MIVNPKISTSHLRGMNCLAFDAVVGMTGLVEEMHGNISELRSPFSRARARTRGITRLVYNSIRGITRLTGAGVDAALWALDPLLAVEPSTTPGLEAARAALNGVVGDHLAETANPLSIPMRLRRNGQPLRLEKEWLDPASN